MHIKALLVLICSAALVIMPAPSLALSQPAAPSSPSTVSLALIFDSHVDPATVQQLEQTYNISYVWGASDPEPPGGSAHHDYYIAWAQGYCPVPGHGYTSLDCPTGGPPSYPWLEKYHPDWILYEADGKTVAHNRFNAGPILNFANPAVQRYWFLTYVQPALLRGFTGIAWDNPVAFNSYSAVGYWKNATTFVKLYSGLPSDPAWVAAQAGALSGFLKLARTVDPTAQFALNVSLDCEYANISTWEEPLKYVQTVVDEEGYSNWGNSDPWIDARPSTYCTNRWLSKTEALIALQKAGKSVVEIDASPLQVAQDLTAADKSGDARAEIQWDLANYLLTKYTATYLWYGHEQAYGYGVIPQPELMADLGTPLGDMVATQSVYERTYTKGLAVVNPSPNNAFTVTLPTGKYQDLYGYPLNSVVMPPHTGLVLDFKGSAPLA